LTRPGRARAFGRVAGHRLEPVPNVAEFPRLEADRRDRAFERPDVFGIAIRVTAVLSREFDSITTEGENGRDW
jgi:hypothetical protein